MPEPIISIGDHLIEIKIFNDPDYELVLNGKQQNDVEILDSVRLILQEVIKADSSNFLLQVTLGEESKYWEMIKLFDICNILGLNRYALFDNKFRVYYFKGEEKFNVDYIFLPEPLIFESKPKNRFSVFLQTEKKKLNYFLQNIKFIWPSAILFLLMLILTFWRLIKQ